MNELLQKHGCANVFTIPDGLKELMSDISREVLRDQPPKIYDFIANYLSVLLITREHGILAVRVLEDLCDCRPSVAESLAELDLTGEQATTIANIIKEEIENTEPVEGKETVKEAQIIKRILTKVILDEVMTAQVCQVARNAYRDYWYRKKLLEQSLKVGPDEPWEIAAERTLQIYKSTKPSFSELTRAAEKIQAAYRGYHVRRNLLTHLKPKKKRGPKVDLPGPPADIASSREIDLGPLININVREDDVNALFDDHATQKLGLAYHPQTAITHIEEVVESRLSGELSRSASHPASPKSESLVQLSQRNITEELTESQSKHGQSFLEEFAHPPRSRSATRVSEPALRQSRPPSQIQPSHLSFSQIPPKVIPDNLEEVKEDMHGEADAEEAEFQAPYEVPEDIQDDRTEGDGESAPTASMPSSAPETDASEVEDIAEDMTTSGEEEG